MDSATDDTAGSGLGMDLSVIAQLWGQKEPGLAMQDDTLKLNALYRQDRLRDPSRLRVLAIAAASDIGANTPIEFLVEGADIDLAVWHIRSGAPMPAMLPAHDIAMVIAPATADGEAALAVMEELAPHWPAPLLNRPDAIRCLERDRLCRRLGDIPGLVIPPTLRVSRDALLAVARQKCLLLNAVPGGEFPIIIRPFGSHAGFGLERIENPQGLQAYLAERPEEGFFVSSYVDYASDDGKFRKYRVVLIGGKPYAVHMAIADQWKVWYLNADMALSVPNRMEEAQFMESFDSRFALHHQAALVELAARLGLDYVTVDCAETPKGELLIFEADHCAIVHDMDPPSVYPYKPGQMRKIFTAFVDMLHRRASVIRSCAA
jgi:glutathione synthase/RimK-type ligase-like ATP-grasp enzyme